MSLGVKSDQFWTFFQIARHFSFQAGHILSQDTLQGRASSLVSPLKNMDIEVTWALQLLLFAHAHVSLLTIRPRPSISPTAPRHSRPALPVP